MKNLNILNWVLPLMLFATASCYRAPEFPVEPHISFNSLAFYDAGDSLVLTIDFEDGDGDLGVQGNENLPPYHPFYFVTSNNQRVISPGNENLLGPSSNDTMPPYNCVDYRLGKIDRNSKVFYTYCTSDYENYFPEPGSLCGAVPDTFYVESNIFAYNFLVDFMVKRDNRYEEFDWNEASSTGCGEIFDQKFPVIFDPDSQGNPLSGELTNTMITAGFVPYFRNDTLKLQVQIIDRALHMSNVIETPAFHFVRTGGRYEIQFLE